MSRVTSIEAAVEALPAHAQEEARSVLADVGIPLDATLVQDCPECGGSGWVKKSDGEFPCPSCKDGKSIVIAKDRWLQFCGFLSTLDLTSCHPGGVEVADVAVVAARILLGEKPLIAREVGHLVLGFQEDTPRINRLDGSTCREIGGDELVALLLVDEVVEVGPGCIGGVMGVGGEWLQVRGGDILHIQREEEG